MKKLKKICAAVIVVMVVVYLALCIVNAIYDRKINSEKTATHNYQFCSHALEIDDDTYVVVTDAGNIFSFKTTTKVCADTEYVVTMYDNGTDTEQDDTIIRIELLFEND